MGILEVLTVIFVVLKCMNIIAWSWWAVFLPEIIVIALYIVLIFVAYLLKK